MSFEVTVGSLGARVGEWCLGGHRLGLLKVGKGQGFLPSSKVPMGLGDQGPGLLGLRKDRA